MGNNNVLDWPLISELVRRRVPRSAGLYVVGAWVTIQVADVLEESLPLADLTKMVILLSIAALPLCLVLTWVFQIGRDGVRIMPPPPAPTRLQAHIALAAAAVLCSFLAWFVSDPSGEETSTEQHVPTLRSVAVLRFLNLTGNEDNAFVSDGLAEELTYKLSRVEGLRVASRTSAFAFHETGTGVREIGRRLRVQSVLEGSIRMSGEFIAVSMKLINAQSDVTVWSQRYQIVTSDLLTIQKQILASLETLLAGPLTKEILTNPTTSVEAYIEYLKGRRVQREPATRQSLALAENHYAEAIRQDQTFARAHAALCEISMLRYRLSRMPENIGKAERQCAESSKLGGRMASIEIALGKLYLASGDFPGARERFEEAREISAGALEAWVGLGRVAARENDFEQARRNFQHAIDAEPNNWLWREHLAFLYYRFGRYGEAVEHYKKVIDMKPESADVWAYLGGVQIHAESYDDAAQSLRHSLSLGESAGAYSNLAVLSMYERKFNDAANGFRRATELSPRDYLYWGNLGDALHFGDIDKAGATEAYAKAIELASTQLDVVNSMDAVTLSSLAVYHAMLDKKASAVQFAESALAIASDDPDTVFFVARAFLHVGDTVRASTELKNAVELGFSMKAVKLDPVLDSLAESGSEDKM